MAYHASTLADLARMRARGQKPDGFVVVGNWDAAQWASRNRFAFVDVRDLGEDLLAFTGLDVLIRMRKPAAEIVQRLTMAARYVTWFDGKRSEFFSA